ncbi:alpha-ketoglutarate-dependent dioxygenase AlkB family protein [Porticoccus sp.]
MSQITLFDDGSEHIDIDLPDGVLRYWPSLIPPLEASRMQALLQSQVAWEQSEITIAGQRRKIPRLNAWYGEPGADYSYSGRLFRALPWLPELAELKQLVERITGAAFNSALVNLYRDGQDSVDWHSDDEPELGRNPVIASISLGAVRRFQIKHKMRRDLPLQTLELGHGSLLLMAGEFQYYWRHRLPKMKGLSEPRVNITFRQVTNSEKPLPVIA